MAKGASVADVGVSVISDADKVAPVSAGIDASIRYLDLQNKEEKSSAKRCSVPPTSQFGSHLTFSWATKVMRAGWKSALKEEDLGDPLDIDSAERNCELLGKDFYDASRTSRKSVMWTYLRVYGKNYFLMGAFTRLTWVALVVAQILALRTLISYVEAEHANENGKTSPSDSASQREAAFAVALLSVGCFLQPILINHLFCWSYRFGPRARAGTSALIWKKVARMSASALNGQRGAEVLNLAEVDTNRVAEGIRYGHFCWAWVFELGLQPHSCTKS